MTDYTKMTTGELRQRIGSDTATIPAVEKELEIMKAENTLMRQELSKRDD